MKEATGDLNMTVVVIVIVAGLVAFFSMRVWPNLKSGIKHESNCSDAICICKKDEVTNGNCDKCYMKEKPGQYFTCPYKG